MSTIVPAMNAPVRPDIAMHAALAYDPRPKSAVSTMVGLVGRPEIKAVADEAEQRLRRACASLGGSMRMQ